MGDSFDATAECLAMMARCRQKRTAAEDEARIARDEEFRRKLEVRARVRQLVEQARDYDDYRRRLAERAAADEERSLAQGLVEVKVLPGPPWTPQWLADAISPRVSDLNGRYLDPALGVTALLFAAERLEVAEARGQRFESRAGFVVREAESVMKGHRTRWVSEDVADEQPQLEVQKRSESYAGRTADAYDRHMRKVMESPYERARRGYRPAEA